MSSRNPTIDMGEGFCSEMIEANVLESFASKANEDKSFAIDKADDTSHDLYW